MFSSIWRPTACRIPTISSSPQASILQQFSSPFSTSRPLLKRKRGQQVKVDQRISAIRYFLKHPKNPPALRFSRSRYLRHWTIHRAWQLFRAQQRTTQQLELERQYNCMRAACEALRLTGEDGLAVTENVGVAGVVRPMKGSKRERVGGEGEGMELKMAAEGQKEVGRLYKIAMMKRGVWEGVPIEYARSQTETPPRAGWNHAWTR